MTLENLDFEMRLETPSVDLYRPDWVPGPDVVLAGMWASGIVTGASGQEYLGLRGWGDFIPGMTHTVSPFCGFRTLQQDLYQDPGHLYDEYAGHDWFEPYQCQESADRVAISYDSGRLVRDGDGCHWYDADGRWELHGTTVSKVFVVHVPAQDGVDREVYYRHELLKAHGTVSGDPVEGYLHQDYCYGGPGLTYTDLPIARVLEGMWVSWIHEHADGAIGGGCFWQGRGGIDFAPGYVLRDGATTAHGDFNAALTFNDDAKITAMHLDVDGDSYDFVLDTVTGPLHVKGRLLDSSSGRPVKQSWCWIEYAEHLLSPEILDAVNERYQLVWNR